MGVGEDSVVVVNGPSTIVGLTRGTKVGKGECQIRIVLSVFLVNLYIHSSTIRGLVLGGKCQGRER